MNRRLQVPWLLRVTTCCNARFFICMPILCIGQSLIKNNIQKTHIGSLYVRDFYAWAYAWLKNVSIPDYRSDFQWFKRLEQMMTITLKILKKLFPCGSRKYSHCLISRSLEHVNASVMGASNFFLLSLFTCVVTWACSLLFNVKESMIGGEV